MSHHRHEGRACEEVEGSTTSGSLRSAGPADIGGQPPLVPTLGGITIESPYMTASPAWVRPTRTLADFVSRTGRLPRQSGANDDLEVKAGNVLRALRRKLAAGTLEDDARAWLNTNVPQWASDNTRPSSRGMRSRRTFAAQVMSVHRFYTRHGMLPSPSGKEQRERQLGQFLGNHRMAAIGKGTASWTESKRLMLDRLAPGWDHTAPEKVSNPVIIRAAKPLAAALTHLRIVGD